MKMTNYQYRRVIGTTILEKKVFEMEKFYSNFVNFSVVVLKHVQEIALYNNGKLTFFKQPIDVTKKMKDNVTDFT